MTHRTDRMVHWAGWIIALYGCAHTIGALTVEGAASHAGAWFSGALWNESFSAMSPAGSAFWFSLDSFGIPLILIGLIVVWMYRKDISPPAFLPWCLIGWTIIDATVLLLTPWPLMLIAEILLVVGIRRSDRKRSRGRRSAESGNLQGRVTSRVDIETADQ